MQHSTNTSSTRTASDATPMRCGSSKISLIMATAAVVLSLTFVFFVARARWGQPKAVEQKPEPTIAETPARVTRTRPPRLPEPEPEVEVEPTDEVAEIAVAIPEPTSVSRPPETSKPETSAPRRPSRVVAYSPMGRPIARVFQNTRTNEPPERMELQTGLDRTLNIIANAVPGMTPPPRLDLRTPGENVHASLDTDIVLWQTDDETLDLAENVSNLKQDLRRYLSEGGNTDTFIEAWHQWLQEAYEARRTAQSRAWEMLRKGDAEGARRYVEQQNAVFAEEGIAPISIPSGNR